jgi:hypothetical protein
VKSLHYPINASVGATVLVNLDQQANVCLFDSVNYRRYRRGEQHHFYGELAKESPVRMQLPHTGRWHIVIDFGGYVEQARASIQVIE